MDDITVIENYKEPEKNPVWSSIYGNSSHPDFSQPVFLRHNGLPVNIIDLYHGETCYLIGRGPSISKVLEDSETRKLLLNPMVMKYGMNSSPEIIDYSCQLWSGVDRMTKFPSRIFKNPSIMKFIPMNRFYLRGYHTTKGKEHQETIAYGSTHTACCPNTIGTHCYLLNDDTKGRISFGKSYLTSPSILYGYYRGFKSVMLFSIKIAILLGFRKIVFLGVDFKMNPQTPYYKQDLENYSKFHVDHNNSLYQFLTPTIKEINDLLKNKTNGYNVELLTSNRIDMMPFIPVIDLKDFLKAEISMKSSG
jgi:hypothetical protein